MTCKDCEKPYVYNLQCGQCIERWIKQQNKPVLKLKAAGTILYWRACAWPDATFKWAESKHG